jgi:Domain of unknown function (DUF6306)
MTNRSNDKAAVKLSSPACSMHEADDAYMGYIGKDELTALLNELLEAEHAGARVTLESARAAGNGPIAELMRRIQRDEAHWCAMLADHVRVLGEAPSPKVGAFYGKAMADRGSWGAHHLPQSWPGLGGAKASRNTAPRAQRSATCRSCRNAAIARSQHRPCRRRYGPRSLNGVGTVRLD